MSGPEVKTDSDNAGHSDLFKTLDLLRLYDRTGEPVYFIVQGLCTFNGQEGQPDNSYLYDYHTCPTNYIPVEAIFTPTDDDPHGVFEYVRSIWLPREFDDADLNDADTMLRALFPETHKNGVTIDGELSSTPLPAPPSP